MILPKNGLEGITMRHIVLDTETTGLDPAQGHRLVEIGCVEVIHYVPTGRVYHQYINPERDIPQGAFQVHGLSESFLKNHPPFREIAFDFLDFVGDDPLVIHNAKFDMRFLNAELSNHGLTPFPMERAIDTVSLARRKFPGGRASLDALCQRFGIDLSKREKHGALLDAELLADVYLELMGGRQPGFGMATESSAKTQDELSSKIIAERPLRPARSFAPTEAEKERHAPFIQNLRGAA
ncbi:MAG: DNA polymerase III subunit epsilon [bacterium]|jgi:DNA polymerase-3 subunit epsilon